jgi:hypothetical protein
VEEYYKECGKAMFQLKACLQRLKHTNLTDSLPAWESSMEDLADDELDTDANGNDIHCDGKSEAGNQFLKAQFGHHPTHNEELCVTSCGMILGWATFYGAEGLDSVQV